MYTILWQNKIKYKNYGKSNAASLRALKCEHNNIEKFISSYNNLA